MKGLQWSPKRATPNKIIQRRIYPGCPVVPSSQGGQNLASVTFGTLRTLLGRLELCAPPTPPLLRHFGLPWSLHPATSAGCHPPRLPSTIRTCTIRRSLVPWPRCSEPQEGGTRRSRRRIDRLKGSHCHPGCRTDFELSFTPPMNVP